MKSWKIRWDKGLQKLWDDGGKCEGQRFKKKEKAASNPIAAECFLRRGKLWLCLYMEEDQDTCGVVRKGEASCSPRLITLPLMPVFLKTEDQRRRWPLPQTALALMMCPSASSSRLKFIRWRLNRKWIWVGEAEGCDSTLCPQYWFVQKGKERKKRLC